MLVLTQARENIIRIIHADSGDILELKVCDITGFCDRSGGVGSTGGRRVRIGFQEVVEAIDEKTGKPVIDLYGNAVYIAKDRRDGRAFEISRDNARDKAGR